jgi:pyruvate formate lyase activating enzyme
VIARDAYRIVGYRLDDRGACRGCATVLPGVFDGPVGTWGGRRQPVYLGKG